jgi:hypothetical protein
MRHLTMLTLSATLLLSDIALTSADTVIVPLQNAAQEKAATLRAQLTEVEAKQSDLQTRLQALDEKLKPENIEQDLAGVGSTKPEDLREQRRRQLEIERNGVRAQLDLLATSHSRLEKAIAQADADAYRQSAAPTTVNALPPIGASPRAASSEPSTGPTITSRPRRMRRKKIRRPKRAHHAEELIDHHRNLPIR